MSSSGRNFSTGPSLYSFTDLSPPLPEEHLCAFFSAHLLHFPGKKYIAPHIFRTKQFGTGNTENPPPPECASSSLAATSRRWCASPCAPCSTSSSRSSPSPYCASECCTWVKFKSDHRVVISQVSKRRERKFPPVSTSNSHKLYFRRPKRKIFSGVFSVVSAGLE